MVGLDYATLKEAPPPAILVQAGKPVRGISGEGDCRLEIDLPVDAAAGAAGGPARDQPDGGPRAA
ncbi:MAG: hypothetical protein H0V73_09745 [Chloroflexi bacterium]|nr:hypothetical protein [Chloroflexota bacterium]